MARRQGGEVIPLESARETATNTLLPLKAVPEPPTLREYVDVILKRIWAVVTFFLIVVTVTGAWVFNEPHVYHTSALIEMNPSAPSVLGADNKSAVDSPYQGWQSKEFFETQSLIIQTRTVCERVVKSLGLDRDPSFLGVKEKDPSKRDAIMRNADAVATLQARLKVDPVKESRIAKVTVEDVEPERAMRLANEVARQYTAYNIERRGELLKQSEDWLSDRKDEIKLTLGHSEEQIFNFQVSHNMLEGSLEDRQAIASQRLVSLNDDLTKIMIEQAGIDAHLRTLDAAQAQLKAGHPEAFESVPAIATDVAITELETQRLGLVEEGRALAARYTPEHPKRIEVEEKRDAVENEIKRRIQTRQQASRSEAVEMLDQEKQIRKNITQAEHEMAEINRLKFDYAKLKREYDDTLKRYETVVELRKDFEIAAQSRENNVQTVEWAITPRTPFKPNRKLLMTLAIILGLLGGVGIALLFEYLDNTIKTHDDIEKYLAAPFLGIVPSIRENPTEAMTALERGRYRDLYSHRRPKSSVAECVRSVRTNLLFMTPEKPLKRLLVASSGPQEGKTTFVTNCAITMAQSGSKTLIIDTDMRRPRIHRVFGLPNDGGMSSLIMQSARLDDMVKETIVPNLYVLPCGPIPPNPSELLHTQRLKQLLVEIDSKFDRIIFDSPPIAAVTDALILAGDVDGVVMVVKAGRTIREVAMRTKQALDDVNARLFGVVLNDLDLERRGYGYYYYYQRYGYYYGESKVQES